QPAADGRHPASASHLARLEAIDRGERAGEGGRGGILGEGGVVEALDRVGVDARHMALINVAERAWVGGGSARRREIRISCVVAVTVPHVPCLTPSPCERCRCNNREWGKVLHGTRRSRIVSV